MTMFPEKWLNLAIGQIGAVPPLAPGLSPSGRLLDPILPIDERQVLERDIWQSLDAKFSWVSMFCQDPAAHSDKIGELAGIIRWLEMSIASWSVGAGNLAELVITMAWLNNDNKLVQALPATFVSNTEFLHALGDFIRDASSKKDMYDCPFGENAVLSLDRLNAAWQQGQWSEVTVSYDATDFLVPSILISTSVRMLARWSPAMFKALADETQDFLTAYAITHALGRRDALQLATSTTSEPMRFACVYGKLYADRTDLTADEAALLTDAFLFTSREPRTWQGWMEIFNRCLLRFPQIQSSLGNALARMPSKAISAYINVLALHNQPHEERKLAAECLRQFACVANKQKRKAVWKLAHRRWQSWNFDCKSANNILTDISWSALDYALTGYYFECCTEAERNSLVADLRDKLEKVDTAWHSSITTCSTQWFRVQSKMQPILQAQTVATAQCDWLTNKLYISAPIEDSDSYFDHKHLRSRRR